MESVFLCNTYFSSFCLQYDGLFHTEGIAKCDGKCHI